MQKNKEKKKLYQYVSIMDNDENIGYGVQIILDKLKNNLGKVV